MSDICLVYTTWPDLETAKTAARTMVEENLAACANILCAIGSIYRWQGKIETAKEVAVLFKTTADKATQLRDRIAGLHPYEVPAIVAWTVDEASSHAPFLDWIRQD